MFDLIFTVIKTACEKRSEMFFFALLAAVLTCLYKEILNSCFQVSLFKLLSAIKSGCLDYMGVLIRVS